jgi:rhomboid family GlyGly-CTERM serine protease
VLKRLAQPGLAWAVFSALLGLMALAAHGVPAERIEWQAAQAWSEPWRWWTAAAVHYSTQHLLANLMGCGVVGAYGWAARLPARWWVWVLAWALAWPLGHLALVAVPGLARYGGLSGVLHAGVAVASVGLLCCERGWRQAIGAAVMLGLLAKLVLERPWLGPVQEVRGWDIPIAPIAHATGAAAGVLCALVVAGLYRLCALLARRRAKPSAARPDRTSA